MRPEALADEVSRRRFENEARTIARLEHPHIVGIHDVGRTRDGLPYYSMPHLTRGHLGQRVNAGNGGMDQARVREILRALLSALGYAHASGTIHRDVKAENVLFDETRSEEHTSELQSLMSIPYAGFCSKKKHHRHSQHTRHDTDATEK